MSFKSLTGAHLEASLIFIPVKRAPADAGEFIAGAIIGGIAGAGAKKGATRNVPQKDLYN